MDQLDYLGVFMSTVAPDHLRSLFNASAAATFTADTVLRMAPGHFAVTLDDLRQLVAEAERRGFSGGATFAPDPARRGGYELRQGVR